MCLFLHDALFSSPSFWSSSARIRRERRDTETPKFKSRLNLYVSQRIKTKWSKYVQTSVRVRRAILPIHGNRYANENQQDEHRTPCGHQRESHKKYWYFDSGMEWNSDEATCCMCTRRLTGGGHRHRDWHTPAELTITINTRSNNTLYIYGGTIRTYYYFIHTYALDMEWINFSVRPTHASILAFTQMWTIYYL